MMKEEFEKFVGETVSNEDYNVIETVYIWHPSISEVSGNTIMIFWSFPVPKKIKKSWRMQQKNYRCLWTFQNGKIYPDSSMIICFLRGQDLLGPIILRTATVLYLKHIHLLESMMKQYRSHV